MLYGNDYELTNLKNKKTLAYRLRNDETENNFLNYSKIISNSSKTRNIFKHVDKLII